VLLVDLRGQILGSPAMSERYEPGYPEDEPVIGGYAPPAPPPLPEPRAYIGGSPSGAGFEDEEPTIGAFDAEYDEYDDDEYDDEYGYYDDEGYDDAPVRQPMFYVFVALAALVGGIVVFLLFSLVNNGGSGNEGPGGTSFAVKIDSPPKDKRIEIGKPEDVIVQASATEPISRFELFVGDKLTDTVNVTETPADNRYRAVLRLTLTARGNYELMVRVTSSSGATRDSEKVTVSAYESVGERPQTIKGKVVADTTLRIGPGDSYPEAGTLKAGQDVTILGKDPQVNWLLVNSAQGDRWVKRTAIDPLDSLDLVPRRDVTPTPAPTQPATSTTLPSPSASASTSPSPNPNSPDFVPTNAVLIDGGSVLRVTIQNVSNNAYNGPLVVSIGGDIPGGEVALAAQLAANGGNATVDFDIKPPVTTAGKKAVVTVDPQNSVKELREDNNGATFVLLPPEESPLIVIDTPNVQPNSISITIRNDGGAMAATNVTVRVKAGNSEAAQSQNIALAKNQTATFQVSKPGTGDAKAEVVINNQVVATIDFAIAP